MEAFINLFAKALIQSVEAELIKHAPEIQEAILDAMTYMSSSINDWAVSKDREIRQLDAK